MPDEIEPAFETVNSFVGKTGCGCVFGLSENLRINKKCQYHAALATIHRTMEGLRAERDEARALVIDKSMKVGNKAIVGLRAALREATSRAEQAEAERDRYKSEAEGRRRFVEKTMPVIHQVRKDRLNRIKHLRRDVKRAREARDDYRDRLHEATELLRWAFDRLDGVSDKHVWFDIRAFLGDERPQP